MSAFPKEAGEGEGKEERGEESRKDAVLEMIMGLVEKVAKEALTKGVRLRAKDVLTDERLHIRHEVDDVCR